MKPADTNERRITSLTQEEIDAKIAVLNQAEHDYDQASTPEQQKRQTRSLAPAGIGS